MTSREFKVSNWASSMGRAFLGAASVMWPNQPKENESRNPNNCNVKVTSPSFTHPTVFFFKPAAHPILGKMSIFG